MKLKEIFEEMISLANQNQQPIPQRYFVCNDGKKAYAEVVNKNPIVMANKIKNVWVKAWD
jgi:hypothetical protein